MKMTDEGEVDMSKKKSEYSGPYLWLAAISLAMPAFVALQAFNSVPDRPYTYREPTPDASGVDQLLWDDLLRAYVANGLVDYSGMKRDFRFKEYLRQVASADPSKLPSRNHKLAFYCNAYNALVINGVIIHKIQGNVLAFKTEDGKNLFGIAEHIVAGETISLDHLEHKMIRPTFKEPRIHVALVCAARSCPSIRGEAFVGERIEQQLEDQTRQFANSEEYVKFENNTLHLSPILNWYKEDFGGVDGACRFVLERVKSKQTRAGIEKVLTGEAEVQFNDYDWTLNSQSEPTASSGKPSSFGSGSIPNE